MPEPRFGENVPDEARQVMENAEQPTAPGSKISIDQESDAQEGLIEGLEQDELLNEPTASRLSVSDTINGLAETDFKAIRTYASTDAFKVGPHRPYVDEVSDKVGTEDIEEFRGNLKEIYMPYYSAKVKQYALEIKPDFFVVNGTSALPYAYMYKEAFRTLAKLRPELNIKIPEFLYIDANPLKYDSTGFANHEELNYGWDNFEDYVDSAWDKVGAAALKKAVRRIQDTPNANIIVFDESSTRDAGSLGVVQRFLENFEGTKVYADSPKEAEAEGFPAHTGRLIPTQHILNPIKRRTEGQGPVITTPSLTQYPEAHRQGLEFVSECKQLGRLFAQSIAESIN